MTTHIEGAATISCEKNVFLSVHQVLQRDLTVVVLNALSVNDANFEDIHLLDAMAGSGIRAIRYAKEVPRVAAVANDHDEIAFKAIDDNVTQNALNEQITPMRMDAIDCMWLHKGRFNVIDLDPFGSVATLLPSAIATISLGGMLCATDTDMHTLQGKNSYSQANCFNQYCALPLTAAYGKELAIRLLLGAADRIAAAYDRMILPVLSTAFDFFVRVHFRVVVRSTEAKSNLSVVHQCSQCSHFHIYELHNADIYEQACPICSQPLQIGGPFWHGDIQDRHFLSASLSEANAQQYPAATRIVKGIMLEDDTSPLFYSLSQLFRPYKPIKPPSLNLFKKAIVSLGYNATSSHLEPMSIKTQASSTTIHTVVKAWLAISDYRSAQAVLQAIPCQNINVFNDLRTKVLSVDFMTPMKCLESHVPKTHQAIPIAIPSSSKKFIVTCTDTLIKALDEAVDDCTIVLQYNRYDIASLHIRKNLNIQGLDKDRMPILLGHVIFEGNATLNVQRVQFQCPKQPIAKAHTILVASGSATFDNCIVEGSVRSLACVCIANGSSALFNQCTIIRGFQAGVYICGKSEAELRHCFVKDMAGCGVDVLGGSSCLLVASTVANCRKSGIFAHAFANITIRESYIDKNAMAGIEVTSHCDALIEDNFIVRGQKGGVLLHSSGHAIIRSNTFNRNCMANIDVRGIGTSAIIERNHICNGRSSGIFISDNGEATVNDNTIIGNKRAGIEAQNADAITFNRNTITGNGIDTLL